MSQKTTESVTTVHFEKRGGSDSKAIINNGKRSSAGGETADEALSKVSEKSKD